MKYKNKAVYIFLYIIFSLQQKSEKISEPIFEYVSEFYIDYLKGYRTNLRYTFMNIDTLNVKNKNINLYSKLYMLFVYRVKKDIKNLISK